VDDLDIWQKDGFDLTEQFHIPDCTPLMKAQVIGTFLKDEGLVSAISPKRSWSFEYLEILVAMLTNIPEMRRNARTIDLMYMNDIVVNFAIDRLSLFSSLTSLMITVVSHWEEEDAEKRSLDLDAIVRSCPFLQNLHLNGMSDYHGSLNNAAHLCYLFVGFDYGAEDFKITSQLIPSKSAQTLSSLSILHSLSDMKEFDYKLFQPFVNLTDFYTNCLTPQFCDLLVSGKFFLTSLTIYLYTEYWQTPLSPERVANIFLASSVKHLRTLNFSLRNDTSTPVGLEVSLNELRPIVYAITSLRYLESLQIDAEPQLSWCDRFAQLRNLKSLFYRIIYPGYDCT
jgi:hypothetical protein